jgi:hypothetical protein
MLRRVLPAVLWVWCVLALASPTMGQTRGAARLVVTVVDQTGAVIPAANVAVLGLEEATRQATIAPAKTDDRGQAVFDRLALGRYSATAEFPGFELGLLRDVRLKSGDNKHVIVLPLQKVAEEVTVGRDAQTAASDRASTFGTAMTREQIESLSEDPTEMQRQLDDLAGPGATLRIDSFEGQQLPPKSQIKAIHITRDSFAAENHSAGGTWIDIITQPGVGPLRGSARFSFYNSALDGKNALIPRKGPSQDASFGMSLNGSLIKQRSSFSLSVTGYNGYTTPNLYAATPTGNRAESLNLRAPNDEIYAYGSLDYAITRDQTLRVTFNRSTYRYENQGVGAYDLIERAYTTRYGYTSLGFQEAGPIGRRMFLNTRLGLQLSDSESASAVQAPTIVVTDAFTAGGAQRAGGSHSRSFSFMSDLDYVRGRHSWRGGLQLNGAHYRSDDTSNYLGTYYFESLAAYQAGTPRSYTRRIGDATVDYWNLQAGLYVQDDIRLRKNLTLSPGVRFEAQTHLGDHSNIGPRMGVTWSPLKSGHTALRASAGIFYDWLSSSIYEQTLRVDGVHQQELNVFSPTYPDPGASGLVQATNQYLLDPDLVMARTARVSAGVDQQINKNFRLGVTFAHTKGGGLLVGHNLNAPVSGVRPNPALANVIESVADGESRTNSISVNGNYGFSSQATGPMMTGPRFDWKRGLMLSGNYYLGKAENNTDGAFSVPASGSLVAEWGPSSSDIRQRFNVSLGTGAFKNLTASVSLNASSGRPYTIRTGYDDNGDLVFNDRPVGVGRNTERAAWAWNSYAYVTYTFGLGKKTVALPPGIMITSGTGGALNVGNTAATNPPRYRLSLQASVQNVTNHANYIGYSGVMTSPFFMKPTAVDGVRRVTLSANVSF